MNPVIHQRTGIEPPNVSVPLRGSGNESCFLLYKYDRSTQNHVSVPLRGSGNESLSEECLQMALARIVSVPLRGSGNESVAAN